MKMGKEKKAAVDGPIYDARTLGTPKMLVLGVQHLFAMFGATVLVPILTGLSVSATLLFAGLATLFMHLVTGKKVPVFLGSSFAFLGGYFGVVASGAELGLSQAEALPYACVGVACAGLLYLILAGICKAFGSKNVMRYFPPVVTGPIIIAIGLILAPSAINNCSTNWWIALVAIVVVIVCNIWGKGMIKIIPILMGVLASYLVAAITGNVDFSGVKDAAWIGLPVAMQNTVFGLFSSGSVNTGLLVSSIIMIVPIAFATMMEHVGDISAISGAIEKNLIEDPGLHRTLIGDGIGTTIAALFGAPANTTYGENTGVLVLTKVYDPKVVRIAAYFAILLSFCPKFDLRGRRPQHGREPHRLPEVPQRHRRGRHPRPGAGRELLRQRRDLLRHRQHQHRPVWPRDRLDRRHPAQRDPPRQARRVHAQRRELRLARQVLIFPRSTANKKKSPRSV